MSNDPDTPAIHLEYFKVTYPVEWVALVEINRPEKMNAFCEPMWGNLAQIFTTLSTAAGVRAIVLTGAGDRGFTAGLDVSQPLLATSTPTDPSRRAHHLRNHILRLQSSINSLAKSSKPIICAWHGYSYGAAIDIGTACDVRLCASNVKLSVREVAIGIPADIGTLSRLPKVVGNGSWVKEVCLTGREFNAAEAEKVGLVSSAVQGGRGEVVGRAMELAREMSAMSPVAVQGTKRVLDYGWDRSIDEGLEYVSVWNSAVLQGDDFPKAAQAALRKEKVRFEKL
ncbi:MAG: hypothetical protein Q9159_003035 [Coniocarpon cinnabarinum]